MSVIDDIMFSSTSSHQIIFDRLMAEINTNPFSIDMQFDAGVTILHAACSSKNIYIVDYALRREAYVNLKDVGGHTALHFAVGMPFSSLENDISIMNTLFLFGSDPKVKDNIGRYPLDLLNNFSEKYKSRLIEVVKLFINFGFDISADDFDAVSLLAKCQRVDEIKLLTDNGIDINAVNFLGRSAIFYVIESSSTKAIEHFLSMGANINIQDKEGMTPLHAAAWSDSSSVKESKILLEHGADINVRDCNGFTPLHLAASVLNYRLVEFFIKSGARIQDKDNRGLTAMGILNELDVGFRQLDYYKRKRKIMKLLEQ